MNSITVYRPIGEITESLKARKRLIGQNIVGIGTDLIEAKAQLGHGDWMEWLRDKAEFSQATANNYMRIAREYEESSQIASLGYAKALALLAMPEEERESFASSVSAGDRSVSEIKRLIAERDAARKLAEMNEKRAKDAQRAADNYCDQLSRVSAAKPEPQVIVQEPADYLRIKEQLTVTQNRLAMAEEDVLRAEQRASEAEAALLDKPQEDSDPLSLVNYCDSVNRLLSDLSMAQYSAGYFADMTPDDRRKYEMMTDSVIQWANRTMAAIKGTDDTSCDIISLFDDVVGGEL